MLPRTITACGALLLATAASVISFSAARADAVATGVAVGTVGSSTPVGITGNALGSNSAIGYFVPLSGSTSTNVVYGTHNIITGNTSNDPSTCGSSGYGTCSDNGDGGSTLTMILRFDFPGNQAPAPGGTLSVRFQDLDVAGLNDPAGFLERLNVLNSSGVSILPGGAPITSAGGLITGNHNEQDLTLALTGPLTDPLFLELTFKVGQCTGCNNQTSNTEEFLVASVSTVPGPIVGAGLPGLVTACGGLIALARRRRARVAG